MTTKAKSNNYQLTQHAPSVRVVTKPAAAAGAPAPATRPLPASDKPKAP